jgi:hypothetical protein
MATVRPGYTPQTIPGGLYGITPMQEALRVAIARLIPDRRRSHRQGWARKEIIARRSLPIPRLLERVIDEAIRDGVPDEDVERVGLVFLDQLRGKLEARRPRPLGVPSLGPAIQNEEAIDGAMEALEIEAVMAPSPGLLQRMDELYARQVAAIGDCRRAIAAFMGKFS